MDLVRADSAEAETAATQGILVSLCDRIGPQRFNAWFRHGTRLTVEENHVRVSVPNPFVANWIETHYRSEIAEVAREHTGKAKPIIVTIDPSLNGSLRKTQLDSQADIVAKATQGRTRPRKPTTPPLPRHKLEDFVVGESNKLAYSAAVAAARCSKPLFSPLFIHGACGLGKTHLLQGICNAVAKRRSRRHVRWRYVTAEQFTNEFVQAISRKRTADFRARYRDLDLLAIDDVHFLAAKKATQAEFLHTFNAIQTSGRQVVMASDAPPNMVGDLNEQLTNRFMAGMLVKIDPPDRRTRVEILRLKARQLHLEVAPDVLAYIGAHIRGSVRELEGALVKLSALSALANGPVTLSLAVEALADHLARTDSAITMGDIEAAVAPYFGVTPADIHSTRRTRAVSVARMITMYLARRHTPMSYPEIARFTGKNHSSVILAVQRMERILAAGDQITWPTPAGKKSMPAAKLIDMLTAQFKSS